MDNNDWRLMGQEKYMKGVHLNRIQPINYAKKLEQPELWHEHCEFCMEKIDMNYEEPCYCTDDEYRFVCVQCYEDFKDGFNWSVD